MSTDGAAEYDSPRAERVNRAAILFIRACGFYCTFSYIVITPCEIIQYIYGVSSQTGEIYWVLPCLGDNLLGAIRKRQNKLDTCETLTARRFNPSSADYFYVSRGDKRFFVHLEIIINVLFGSFRYI